mgnify:CR=1 FL=1|jgi:hypothetical protein|tara:strand:+ start:1470 stop:1778 length:309 start_codon:yes stop_codon:yes gene_type:complete
MECPEGQIPNEDGTACIDEDVAAWYADPNFWAAMAANERASGSTPDPMAMIAALINQGQQPGQIDVEQAPTVVLQPAASTQPPQWFYPALIGIGALVLLRRR